MHWFGAVFYKQTSFQWSEDDKMGSLMWWSDCMPGDHKQLNSQLSTAVDTLSGFYSHFQ